MARASGSFLNRQAHLDVVLAFATSLQSTAKAQKCLEGYLGDLERLRVARPSARLRGYRPVLDPSEDGALKSLQAAAAIPGDSTDVHALCALLYKGLQRPGLSKRVQRLRSEAIAHHMYCDSLGLDDDALALHWARQDLDAFLAAAKVAIASPDNEAMARLGVCRLRLHPSADLRSHQAASALIFTEDQMAHFDAEAVAGWLFDIEWGLRAVPTSVAGYWKAIIKRIGIKADQAAAGFVDLDDVEPRSEAPDSAEAWQKKTFADPAAELGDAFRRASRQARHEVASMPSGPDRSRLHKHASCLAEYADALTRDARLEGGRWRWTYFKMGTLRTAGRTAAPDYPAKADLAKATYDPRAIRYPGPADLRARAWFDAYLLRLDPDRTSTRLWVDWWDLDPVPASFVAQECPSKGTHPDASNCFWQHELQLRAAVAALPAEFDEARQLVRRLDRDAPRNLA